MFFQAHIFSLVVGSLFAGTSAAYHPGRAALKHFRRWDSSTCTAELSGVPIPDNVNFNLPLENYRQSQCWDLCIGDQASCTTKSQVCYDFVGLNLVFYFKSAPGYTYTEADIWLGLSAPNGSPAPQFTSANGFCTLAADGSDAQCTIPYSQITSNPDVLAGMCPDGDQQALTLYLYTNAWLTGSSGPVQAEGRLSCTDYPTCSSYYPFTYWELGYRCTKCPIVTTTSTTTTSTTTTSTTTSCTTTTSTTTTSTTTTCHTSSPTPPPVTKSCSFGTAFGYSAKNPTSLTLNTISPLPNTCKRWGWYEKPTTAQLSAGIGGPLYVGAGQNDISKATAVGLWSASLNNGKVYVTFSLSNRYSLAQVHIDIGCTPISTCSPGQYKYVGNAFATSPAVTSFTTPGLSLPSCSSGLYLIVHADINSSVTIPAWSSSTFTCPAPIAK